VESVQRKSFIKIAASYIATRVEKLRLRDDPTAELAEHGRHYGSEQFADYLCHAYGGRAIAALRRARIQHELTKHKVPYPTFIDGRMRRLEWVEGPNHTIKSDFEQHGLGKYEHSITDPAYDIADVILNFGLTHEEEKQLVNQYVNYGGDADVGRRLFLNKIQAGTWAMSRALSNLVDSRLAHCHEEFHQRFTEAWSFLTIHTARRCGSLFNRQGSIGWKSPIVVLDVDGVLDKHVFGFPSTTMAGIQAVSLLQNHGFTLALNTARTTEEVKEYCRAYGFAGGVAEYGGWAWDALTGREVTLVNQLDREQLYELARTLRELPGVFVNERYHHSLRAYTFGPNGTVPLPTPMIETLMIRMKLDRLRLRQTSMDTTVIPRAIDKGKGLMALKALAGQENAETVMIGDTEPDLAAFAVSQRSFAPANVNCRSAAESLGCKVLHGSYQVGLLQMAQSLVHPDGKKCDRCGSMNKAHRMGEQDLFVHLLKVADQGRLPRLLGALCDSKSYLAFVK
jgi:hydroxymethylpyrimidine pyrophosphatase-like HAD family hydrolase